MTLCIPTMQKDVYKEFHVRAYHPDVSEVYTNFTSRSGRLSNIPNGEGVVFVGLQYFIIDYLIREWNEGFFNLPNKEFAVSYHKRIMSAMVGYDVDTKYLEDLYELGYLPLRIKALDEGTIVPYQVAPLTIVNTVEGFQWLPNMIETVLSTENWPIQTSATTSVAYMMAFKKAFEETGGPEEVLPFMCHDFSFRGMFGRQAAAMSGFGHLASGFAGTDTIPAVVFAEQFYGANVDKELVGASVDATEHSVTCSWLYEGEEAFFNYLMDEKSTSGILSVVADTWDFWNLVTNILPKMKDKIMARDGKLVIRPDSGDPTEILCGIEVKTIEGAPTNFEHWKDWVAEELDERFCEELDAEDPHYDEQGVYRFGNKVYNVQYVPDLNRHDKQYYYVDNYGSTTSKCTFTEIELTAEQKGLVECLWDTFGGTVTDKGFKLLDEHIGAIYGDAITLERQAEIIRRLKDKGFVPAVVLGVGSYSFQYVTRDTHGSAVKATNVVKAGVDMPIFKDPKTDTKKKSAKGFLRVEREDGKLVMFDEQTREQEKQGLLKTVFLNGKLVRKTTLAEIRQRVQEQF